MMKHTALLEANLIFIYIYIYIIYTYVKLDDLPFCIVEFRCFSHLLFTSEFDGLWPIHFDFVAFLGLLYGLYGVYWCLIVFSSV